MLVEDLRKPREHSEIVLESCPLCFPEPPFQPVSCHSAVLEHQAQNKWQTSNPARVLVPGLAVWPGGLLLLCIFALFLRFMRRPLFLFPSSLTTHITHTSLDSLFFLINHGLLHQDFLNIVFCIYTKKTHSFFFNVKFRFNVEYALIKNTSRTSSYSSALPD